MNSKSITGYITGNFQFNVNLYALFSEGNKTKHVLICFLKKQGIVKSPPRR